MENCPFCKSPLVKYGQLSPGQDAYFYNCSRCGEYALTGTVQVMISPDINNTQIANISGWFREHQKELIGSNDYKRLLELKTPTVDEKADKLFKHFANAYPIAGQKIIIKLDDIYTVQTDIQNDNVNPQTVILAKQSLPLLSVSWSHDLNELKYLLSDYLESQKGFLTFTGYPRITPEGWEYLNKDKYVETDSQACFVAMWFDDSMDFLWDVLESSINEAGYEANRVDKHHHVNRIDDEIVSLIRQSKFIVADYTGQRAGVYFESGFALGLGKNVIWTCDNDDFENLHFDTSHYNFLLWEKDKLDRFANNLKERIIAIVGKGKIQN